MGFSDFHGNEEVVRRLREMLARDRFPQAVILAGPAGAGKYTLALMLAKAINCLAPIPSGGTLETCAILTTTANPLTSAVHDRMPVILERADYDLWLDPGMLDVGAVSDRLKPYDAGRMRCSPVGTRINRVANDDEECSKAIEAVPLQHSLFS